MRLVTDRGLFHFGVASALAECVPVATADRPTSSAPAAPGEADPPQLRAAEQLGFFPYPDAVHDDSVKGHAA